MTDTTVYTGLIPSSNAAEPNFVRMVSTTVQPFVDQQTAVASLTTDVDTAVGNSLDYIGQWIGLITAYLLIAVMPVLAGAITMV